MRTLRLLLVLLFIPLVIVHAQRKDEEALSAAVRRLNQAMIDANHIQLDELTSEKLSYGHSSGLIEDKDAFITAIIDGTSGFVSIDLSEQTITIHDGVGIVRHRFAADTNNKGQAPGHITLGVMQVWQREKGRWLLLARHATRLP